MNQVIIGFGYIIPTGFYNIEHRDLVVFDSGGVSFVTFTNKHIFFDDFNGKSVPIDDSITPNIEEMQMIGVFCETEDMPSLQVFTRKSSVLTSNRPNYDNPTFGYPIEEAIDSTEETIYEPNLIQPQNEK